jgi:uncharacterized protein RhaS with RHS repeats
MLSLELGDKAQTLSYEHYYPYGGTAIIAGKDKTQAQQKRYRYTGKEKDDSSGLCYYDFRVVKCALLQPKYSTFFDLPYKR